MPRPPAQPPGHRRGGSVAAERQAAPPPHAAAGLERALELAGEIVLVLDAEGRVLDLLGSERDVWKTQAREWRGRPWAEIVTVESRPKVADMLRDALAEPPVPARPRQVNHPMRTGDDVPVLYTAVPAAYGSHGRVVAIGRDQRSTMRLQQRLVEAQQGAEHEYARFRDAESRYRHLFQASGEPTLLVDLSTLRVREANPAAQALLAGRSARAVGTSIAGLFEPAAAEAVQDLVARVRTEGRHDGLELRLIGDGGRVRIAAALLQDAGTRLLLLRLLLLPEPGLRSEAAESAGRSGKGRPRSQAPAGLPSAGDRLSGLSSAYLRSAGDALVFTDAQGQIVAANPAMTALLRLPGEDALIGAPLERWLGSSGVELAVLMARLAERGAAASLQTQCRDVLGAEIDVEVRASRLDSSAPAPAQYAFALRERRNPSGPEPSGGAAAGGGSMPHAVKQLTTLVGRVPLKQIVSETVDLIEQMSIVTALDMTHNNRVLAAQLLGLSRQSLYIKLRRFGIGGDGGGEVGLESGAGDGDE